MQKKRKQDHQKDLPQCQPKCLPTPKEIEREKEILKAENEAERLKADKDTGYTPSDSPRATPVKIIITGRRAGDD